MGVKRGIRTPFLGSGEPLRMNRLTESFDYRVLGSHRVEGVFCVEVIAGVERLQIKKWESG